MNFLLFFTLNISVGTVCAMRTLPAVQFAHSVAALQPSHSHAARSFRLGTAPQKFSDSTHRKVPNLRLRAARPVAVTAGYPVRAAIVGGGLGGLAAAIALRAVGVDAHVYERTTELRGTAGTGLTLWPNGLSALSAIDSTLVAEIEQVGSPTTLVEVTTADGATKLPNPTGDPRRFPQTYGQPMLNIRWAHLQRILASRVPKDRLHLGHTFDGIEMADPGAEMRVAVRFKSTETQSPLPPAYVDFVVGADGINSAMRGLLVGDGAPRDAGRIIWRAIIPLDTTLLPRGASTVSAGAGKVGFLAHIGGEDLYWSAFATDEAIEQSGLDRADFADVKAYLLEQFADVYRVRECIARTPVHDILERRVADRQPLVDANGVAAIPWGRERDAAHAHAHAHAQTHADADADAGAAGAEGVGGQGAVGGGGGGGGGCGAAFKLATLLGDAFHAMIPSLGQGANSSFEGAYRLAKAIKEALSAGEKSAGLSVEESAGEMAGEGAMAGDVAGDVAELDWVHARLARALRAYESKQMERVHWIVEASAAQGRTVYEDMEEFMRKQGLAQDQMWGVDFEALE